MQVSINTALGLYGGGIVLAILAWVNPIFSKMAFGCVLVTAAIVNMFSD